MNIFAISGFINGVLFLLMGVFVFSKNIKSRLNQFFALFCLGGTAWAIFYGFWQMAESESEALFFLRLLMSGGSLLAFFLCCCIFEILNLIEEKKNIISVFLIGTLINIFLAFSPYLSYGVRKLSFFSYWPIGGPAWNFFVFFGFFEFGYSMYLLMKQIKHFTALERERIKYLALAITIAGFGIATNTLQWYGVDHLPYGNFIIFLSPLILLFAISKYHLFEIKVILTEFLVGLIGLISLAQAFLAETLRGRILGFSVFFLFCFIGYLLIKSTYREVKAKEILEQKVQERTREIEKRKQDLEKFYSLTVGRELKMIELKGKIKEMEERSEK